MKRNLVGKILGKIKIFVQDFVPIRTALSDINGKYSNCRELFTPPVCKTSRGVGKIQGNTTTPQYYYYCCTADLTEWTVHNVCGLRPFIIIIYLPCFRRAGGQYPTSLLMLVVVAVVLFLFKEKSECA